MENENTWNVCFTLQPSTLLNIGRNFDRRGRPRARSEGTGVTSATNSHQTSLQEARLTADRTGARSNWCLWPHPTSNWPIAALKMWFPRQNTPLAEGSRFSTGSNETGPVLVSPWIWDQVTIISPIPALSVVSLLEPRTG